MCFNRLEFQTLLAIYNTKSALELAEKVGVNGIDFTRTYTRLFVSYWFHFCEGEKYAEELFAFYKKAGLVTRDNLCNIFTEKQEYNNILTMATQYSSFSAYDCFKKNVSPDIADWSVQSPLSLSSPLLEMLSIVERLLHDDEENDDNQDLRLTKEQMFEYDKRSAQLVEILPDFALNAIDSDGKNPMVLCIKQGHVLTLKALIQRLPEVNLLPHYKTDLNYYSTKDIIQYHAKNCLNPDVVALLRVACDIMVEYCSDLEHVLKDILPAQNVGTLSAKFSDIVSQYVCLNISKWI